MAKVPPTLDSPPAENTPAVPAGGVEVLEETVEVSSAIETTYRPRGFGVTDIPGGKRMNFLVTPFHIVGVELVEEALDGLIAQLRPEAKSALWTPDQEIVRG